MQLQPKLMMMQTTVMLLCNSRCLWNTHTLWNRNPFFYLSMTQKDPTHDFQSHPLKRGSVWGPFLSWVGRKVADEMTHVRLLIGKEVPFIFQVTATRCLSGSSWQNRVLTYWVSICFVSFVSKCFGVGVQMGSFHVFGTGGGIFHLCYKFSFLLLCRVL